MPQGALSHVLRELEIQSDPRVLVGPRTLDDAGVVVLGESEGMPPGSRLGLVQTVDFFPPVVDDPWYYGAIAAANSLSDVYAMGGRPLSVLNLASFPKGFPDEWIGQILKGGYDKVRESGAVVAGGHTVQNEIQFGFAVTGLVDPDRVAANSGARAGDVAYLTKPIGMGSVTTAAKRGHLGWDVVEPAAKQMATLNDVAADAMATVHAHACTDVTGFGLVGHGRNIAAASGLCLRIDAGAVPIFGDALEYARKGWTSGGAKRGRASLAEEVEVEDSVEEALANLCFDAETSGGLLIVVDPSEAATLESSLRQRALPIARVGIFEAPPREGLRVRVVGSDG